MTTRIGLFGLLLIASASAFAQSSPAYLFVNNSSAPLVDDAAVKALFSEMVSPRLGKLYPAGVWGFATQVHGGFTEDKTCVIAASTMLLPRNRPSGTKLMLFKPKRTAAAFGALPNATAEQCAGLAKSKIREANQAMVAALIPN